MTAWLAGRRVMMVGAGEAVESVALALAGHGATVLRASAALVDAPEIAAVFEAEAGAVDILVHAGTQMTSSPAETIGLEGWRASQCADIDSRFLYSAEYVRRKRAGERAGAILFLMPSAAVAPGRVAMLSAHGALDNLVKSLAVEWARDGIRVNAIASRVVEQPAAATAAQVASLSQLAAYLVSDYAAYITGSIMGISEYLV